MNTKEQVIGIALKNSFVKVSNRPSAYCNIIIIWAVLQIIYLFTRKIVVLQGCLFIYFFF